MAVRELHAAESLLTAVRAITIFCFTPTPAATAAHNLSAFLVATEGGREEGRGEQAQVFVEDEFNFEDAKSAKSEMKEERQVKTNAFQQTCAVLTSEHNHGYMCFKATEGV